MSELPVGWLPISLGEVGTLYCGQSPSAADVNSGGMGTPYVTGPEQWDGQHIHRSKWTTNPRRTVPDGCIFVTVKGAGVGTLFPGIACAIGRDVYAYQPSKKLDPGFVLNALTKNIQNVIAQARGTIPGLSKEHILGEIVGLPPLAEQQRIVAKLDALTARTAHARAELDRVPVLAERQRQALLIKAFSGELTAEWIASQPGQQHPVVPRGDQELRAKYRMNEPSEGFDAPYDIPSTWRWLRLPELGDMDRGKSRHRPRDDERLFGGPFPFVQTGEVRAADRYLDSYSKTYSAFGLEQSRLWPIRTVCITISANIAETAILRIEACFPDSVVGFTADETRCLPEFVEYFVRTAKADLEQFAPATAQKNINLDVLASVRVPVAPLAEQGEIIRRLDHAFTEIDRLVAEAAAARRLLDRLDQQILAKAFRGELVPQDPADEPASVLLERIRAERGAAPETARRGRRSKAA